MDINGLYGREWTEILAFKKSLGYRIVKNDNVEVL